jgi:hypothetical protein
MSCPRGAFSRRAGQAVATATTPPGRQKNTGDLQWKIDAVCNVRPCRTERKGAGARAMGSNGRAMEEQWKSNGKAMEKQWEITPRGIWIVGAAGR